MSMKVDIKKRFKGFNLEVSFETKGKRIGILGASGCGKSMTLKCIAGIEKPDSGKIILGQTSLYDSLRRLNLPPQQRKVGYLFQNYALFPNMTVEQNIGVGVKQDKKLKESIIKEQLQRFHLEGLEKRYPAQLSGGQQQRVALARIFAYEPEVILLDEPFSALDSFLKDTLQQELLDILEDFKGDIIIVSHNRDELYTLCDQLIVMEKGKPLVVGNTKDIFKNPEKVEVAKLTGCKNISPIKRLNSHELLALDWQVKLKTKEEIKEHIRYVSIRAHDLRLCDSKQEDNTLQAELVGALEYPFEMQYLFKNSLEKSAAPLCMKIGKDRRISTSKVNLQLPSEALRLLE